MRTSSLAWFTASVWCLLASATSALAQTPPATPPTSPALECEVFEPEQTALRSGTAADRDNDWAAIMEGAQGRIVVGVQCTFLETPLTDAQLEQVAVQEVVAGGVRPVTVFKRYLTGTPAPGKSGFTLYTSLRLHNGWGLGRSARTYKVLIPNRAEAVTLTEKEWQEDAKRLGSAGISAAILDGDDDNLGVRFEGRWVLDQNLAFAGLDGLSVSVNTDGEISSDDQVKSFSRSINAEISIAKFVRLGRASGAQLLLTPITISSDQDLDVVVGRTTVGALVRVPGSQHLAGAIGRALGCKEAGGEESNCVNAGLFVGIDGGVKYDLRTPDGKDEETTGAWGARAFYNFPLSTNWDLTLRGSYRDDGGDSKTAENYEVSLRYFVNCPRRAAFTISYIDGEFSPLGDQIDGLRLGLTTLLGNVAAPVSSNPRASSDCAS